MKHVSGFVRAMLVIISVALIIGCIPSAQIIARARISDLSADDTSKSARELWEKVLAAKGGRERLRQITGLYAAADLGKGWRSFTFNAFSTYRYEFVYDPKREVTVVEISNARKGMVWWQVDANEARPRKYNEEEVYQDLLPQFIYLMVTHELDPVPLRLRKERIGLKRVDVIETDANGWRVDYYIDSDSNLPIRVVLPLGTKARAEGEMNHIVTLDDYAAVDGVMMPHTVIHTNTFNSQKLTDSLKFEINPAYDPRLFEQAPTPKMGAEPWRPKT